ncbi:hypothetical protein VIAQ111709_19865 [Vibrio aquimaris]|uniref:Uncharacterized protein n=1 Tax=Vibrio aquimaris TaxID=2587862 RepID=A0A5P9CRF2_9VIBR|nr:hypothetical protein FIV01_20770 [Vibrio aquimaris]
MRGISQVHSKQQELDDARARLKAYQTAELEILTKGQEVKGEEDTALKRASLSQVRQAITSIQDEIRDLEHQLNPQPDDGYELSEIQL